MNLDGKVDGLDVNIVSANFESGTDYSSGDANGDGSVNQLDLSLIANYFGQTESQQPVCAGSESSYQLVPEPSAMLLMGIGVTVLLARLGKNLAERE